MRLAPLLRAPLVQFLAIGAAVAGLFALVEDDAPEAPPPERPQESRTIVVSEGDIAQLRERFTGTWQRPPTEAEMDSLVDAFIMEEALYRAGRALGLDVDDPVIRRRVAQKMEFLLEPAPDELEPTEEDLAAHLARHRERFRKPPRIALRQVTFDPERRGENLEADIEAARTALAEGADPADHGDSTLLPPAIELSPVLEVERSFGAGFADAVLALPEGVWDGPVPSPFGLHLVLVEAREAARDPPLEEVREAVRADWIATRGRALLGERIGAIRARYDVVVERPEAADAPAGNGRRAEAADRENEARARP